MGGSRAGRMLLPAWMVEEGLQGPWALLEAEKGMETSPHSTSRRKAALPTPLFGPSETHFGLETSKTVGEESRVILSH